MMEIFLNGLCLFIFVASVIACLHTLLKCILIMLTKQGRLFENTAQTVLFWLSLSYIITYLIL